MLKLSQGFCVGMAAFACSSALAAPLQIPTNVPIVEVAQQTNTYTFTPVNETNSTIKRVVPISHALVTGQSVSDVEPKVSTTRRLPIGTGADVTASVKIPRKNIAKALVASAKGAGKLLLPGVGAIALEAMLDYGLKNIKVGPDGVLQADAESQKDYPKSDGYYWAYNNDDRYKELTKEAACERTRESHLLSFTVRMVEAGFAYCDWKNTGGFITTRPIFRRSANNCSSGSYVDNGVCTPDKPLTSMTEQDIEDWIASRDGWPSSAARALQGMLGEPSIRPSLFTPDLDQNLTLQGPNSKTGKTTKTTEPVQLLPGTNTVAPPGTPPSQTQPGTKTTTTTKTHPITYSGNSVSYTTNNTTNTSITNNVTNVTTNETKTEEIEDDKEDQMPSDIALGDLPKLYEQKYPEGLAGVWNQRSQEFKSSGLFSLAEQLMPTSLNGGTCPSFNMDLSIGPWADYGTHEVPMPCWIWDTCKYILLLIAAVSARRIVFGG